MLFGIENSRQCGTFVCLYVNSNREGNTQIREITLRCTFSPLADFDLWNIAC